MDRLNPQAKACNRKNKTVLPSRPRSDVVPRKNPRNQVYRRTHASPAPADDREMWVVKDVQAGKVKSTHREIAILGEQAEKLVDLFRTEWKHAGLLVKFKLEVGISKDDLIQIGQMSRKSSGADYLVANTLDMVAGDRAGAYLLSDSGDEWVPRNDLPARLKRLLVPDAK